MARKARTSRLTQVALVPLDDDTIGPEADRDKYLETLDEKHLDLQGVPDRYYIRGFTQAVRDMAADVLGSTVYRTVDTGEKDADGEPILKSELRPEFADLDRSAIRSENRSWSREYAEFVREVARECVVGFDCHVYATGVDSEGNTLEATMAWKPGAEAPANYAQILCADEALMGYIVRGLFAISTLTLAEKKP